MALRLGHNRCRVAFVATLLLFEVFALVQSTAAPAFGAPTSTNTPPAKPPQTPQPKSLQPAQQSPSTPNGNVVEFLKEMTKCVDVEQGRAKERLKLKLVTLTPSILQNLGGAKRILADPMTELQVSTDQRMEELLGGLHTKLKDLLEHPGNVPKVSKEKLQASRHDIIRLRKKAQERARRFLGLNMIAGAATAVTPFYWEQLYRELKTMHFIATYDYRIYFWLYVCSKRENQANQMCLSFQNQEPYSDLCSPLIERSAVNVDPMVTPVLKAPVPKDSKQPNFWQQVGHELLYAQKEDDYGKILGTFEPRCKSKGCKDNLEGLVKAAEQQKKVKEEKKQKHLEDFERESRDLDKKYSKKLDDNNKEYNDNIKRLFEKHNDAEIRKGAPSEGTEASRLESKPEIVKPSETGKEERQPVDPKEKKTLKQDMEEGEKAPEVGKADPNEAKKGNILEYETSWKGQFSLTNSMVQEIVKEYKNDMFTAGHSECPKQREEDVNRIQELITEMNKITMDNYLSNEKNSQNIVNNVCESDKKINDRLIEAYDIVSRIGEKSANAIRDTFVEEPQHPDGWDDMMNTICFLGHFVNVGHNLYPNILGMRSQWQFSEYAILAEIDKGSETDIFPLNLDCAMNTVEENARNLKEAMKGSGDTTPCKSCSYTISTSGFLKPDGQGNVTVPYENLKINDADAAHAGSVKCHWKASKVNKNLEWGEGEWETDGTIVEVGKVTCPGPTDKPGIYFVSLIFMPNSKECSCPKYSARSVVVKTISTEAKETFTALPMKVWGRGDHISFPITLGPEKPKDLETWKEKQNQNQKEDLNNYVPEMMIEKSPGCAKPRESDVTIYTKMYPDSQADSAEDSNFLFNSNDQFESPEEFADNCMFVIFPLLKEKDGDGEEGGGDRTIFPLGTSDDRFPIVFTATKQTDGDAARDGAAAGGTEHGMSKSGGEREGADGEVDDESSGKEPSGEGLSGESAGESAGDDSSDGSSRNKASDEPDTRRNAPARRKPTPTYVQEKSGKEASSGEWVGDGRKEVKVLAPSEVESLCGRGKACTWVCHAGEKPLSGCNGEVIEEESDYLYLKWQDPADATKIDYVATSAEKKEIKGTIEVR